MMCSILYSGEKETAVEVWCLHYNQVRRHGDVRCLSILVSLVSSKVMNITYYDDSSSYNRLCVDFTAERREEWFCSSCYSSKRSCIATPT